MPHQPEQMGSSGPAGRFNWIDTSHADKRMTAKNIFP
jgi:hypothetical protein